MRDEGVVWREMPEEPQWAYLAGLMDGEGCIALAKRKEGKGEPTYSLRVTLSQKNRSDLEKIKRLFRGSISGRNLQWTGLPASLILVGILPYSLFKADQILLGLRFFHEASTYGKKEYRQNKKLAEYIYRELQRLKKVKYGRI